MTALSRFLHFQILATKNCELGPPYWTTNKCGKVIDSCSLRFRRYRPLFSSLRHFASHDAGYGLERAGAGLFRDSASLSLRIQKRATPPTAFLTDNARLRCVSPSLPPRDVAQYWPPVHPRGRCACRMSPRCFSTDNSFDDDIDPGHRAVDLALHVVDLGLQEILHFLEFGN